MMLMFSICVNTQITPGLIAQDVQLGAIQMNSAFASPAPLVIHQTLIRQDALNVHLEPTAIRLDCALPACLDMNLMELDLDARFANQGRIVIILW